ncbi:IgA FC receptor-like isoform X2 [Nilaparvata lugens]|nr:IgA FC receptor-like isoform X2 [Nilaparvata lugens]
MRNFRGQLINSTQKCTDKYNVAAIEVFNMIGQDIIPPREGAKCYFLCMMQEFDLMDEKGQFNESKLESLLNYFPKKSNYTETIETKLDTCLKAAKNVISQQSKYDGCNRAYTLVKCMYDSKSSAQIQNSISGVGKKMSGMMPTVPQLPSLPMPSMPQLPSLPIPSMPQLPSLPMPSMPQLPSLPIPSMPQLPSIPVPQIPNIQISPSMQLPSIPGLPSVPQLPSLQLPKVDLPQLPAAPQLPSFPYLFGKNSNVNRKNIIL